MPAENSIHDFEVVAVEQTDEASTERLAIVLTDTRGGKVKLHLADDLAETLREQLTIAITKRQGP